MVVHRYGAEIRGGAEQHCRLAALHMSRCWRVTVLSSCATDYFTWENVLPAGESREEGVRVLRFPTERPREMADFVNLSQEVMRNPQDADLQKAWAIRQGPETPHLLEHLDSSREEYDLILFFSYLYYHTVFGLPLVADRAVLAPLAHDEPPLQLPIYDSVFRAPQLLLFNSVEERTLLRRRFADGLPPGMIVGVGLDDEKPLPLDDSEKRALDRLPEDFYLYIGRIDPSKGVLELFHHFFHSDLRPALVLAGELRCELPNTPRILWLGPVSEGMKRELIRRSIALVQPSPYESLSLSVLEAWREGRPVLVNGRSPVLRGQVVRSGGGASYQDGDEFRAAAAKLAEDPGEGIRMGFFGKRYYLRNYSWGEIECRFEKALTHVLQ